MKKHILLIFSFVLLVQVLLAQVPGKFNYQAVIRNNAGELIAEQDVNIQISILDNLPEGDLLYRETHSKLTNAFGVVNLIIGEGADITGDFSQINWGYGDKYLKIEVNAGNGFTNLGTIQLLSVPYSLYSEIADSSNIASMAYTAGIADLLGSKSVYSTNSDTLFVVKDHVGNVVFAVFPDGAQIIVNEAAKGKVGGFAVSGRSPSKAADIDILKITSDSTRIFVNDTVTAKGKVGGFAVSGRSPSKNNNTDLLFINADSTRVYVNEVTTTKGKVGGFAVSGRSPAKGINRPMFFTTFDSTRIYTNDTISGFGIRDNSAGTATSYMQLTPLNYFIGHRAGESITTGKYNTFIGYETGKNSTWGNGNMFIGFNAGHENIDGALNIFIGNEVGYSFTGVDDGEENVFIGNKAGRNVTTVANSIFIGTQSGLNCSSLTYSNTFIGDRTGANGNPKSLNTFIGASAGFHSSGENNTYIGAYAGNANYSGNNNVFVGYQAGSSETGSNKLYIANNNLTTLIYGDFSAKEVTIDGDLYATTVTPSDFNLKHNFTEIKSGLKLISALTGYYFNWNDHAKEEFNYSDEEQIGVIAQDVEKVLPQLIVINSKGYKAVDYSKLSPVIIQAIKEQQTQIEDLKTENEILKQKLEEITDLLKSK